MEERNVEIINDMFSFKAMASHEPALKNSMRDGTPKIFELLKFFALPADQLISLKVMDSMASLRGHDIDYISPALTIICNSIETR